MAVKLNEHDLTFILQQIKIAEAHSNGIPLTEIRLAPDGSVIASRDQYDAAGVYLGLASAPRAIPDPHTPFGLRTVDGSFNNLVSGREQWGAADGVMPRMLEASYRDDADGDVVAGVPGTTTNYANPGNIADADPRIISNLIVDMTVNNPVAVDTWFKNEIATAKFEETHGKLPARPGSLGVGVVEDATHRVVTNADLALIPNIAPDEGISAPFNAWMTFFGQFFDHGLDLISKSGGTIFIPLRDDDPLVVGGDGELGTADDLPPHLRFMAITRAEQVVGADGVVSQKNTTTPFVDQNQTYTSHASHQVFLREYALVDGQPLATGRLLNGASDGLPTWGDVKAQALTVLGINLTDYDVLNVPLLRTDAYGEFVRGPNGFPQLILDIGLDGTPNTSDDVTIEGNPDAPIGTFADHAVGATVYHGVARTAHAFLDDIAHNAAPGLFDSNGDHVPDSPKLADGDAAISTAADLQPAGTYDDDLLDAHFITGDGRGNENIGLTAVHHIFHSEHNRQVELNKLTILQTGNLDFINQWHTGPNIINANDIPTDIAELKIFAETLSWDGERLFQAARFATEMQYQHLVFEEFGRKIQPAIDPFVFNSATDIDPAIFSEFANTVYRFGHSMLTDEISRIFVDATGKPLVDANWSSAGDIGLIEAFLNPIEFGKNADGDDITADEAAGAIVRGLTLTHGNAIDEFVVDSLRSNLLGLPLDLAAINIARGRDTGVPTLNEAREQLYAATGSTFLKPYDSWVEFALGLKNPMSVINFIAAYGVHPTIAAAGDDLSLRRAAATDLVLGVSGETTEQTAARRAWLNADASATGLDDVDLWIGGLAEKILLFGGMLGSTFNAVFETQLENLQDGDRFYYLTRTQGLNFLNELEANAFSKLIMANTDLTQDAGPDGIKGTEDDSVVHHIGVDSFGKYDYLLEVNQAMQIGDDPVSDDPILAGLGVSKVGRDDPSTPGADTNYLRFIGAEHVVLGGTDQADTLIGDLGDDGIWGGRGDDRIEGGQGVDLILGGAGDDIITDEGDTGDFIKGEEGDDVIANSNGIDILMGGDGKDAIFVGVDSTEVFAGEGDDFVLGGDGVDFLLGNEGDDWLEGGAGFDTTAGDNSELFFNSTIIGHDVMFAGSDEHDFDAESGDDIMVQGESVIRNEGMFGFDWGIFKGMATDGYADLGIPIFTTEQADILRNRFDKVEALSGWDKNDTLIGDDRIFEAASPGATVGATEGVFFNDGLDQAGIDRIAGLQAIVQIDPLTDNRFESGNILLGGGGDDILQGNGGDDILDGDRWLNVRISIRTVADDPQTEIATVDSLKHTFADDFSIAAFRGKSLFELLVSREILPGQMQIVREIKIDDAPGSADTAVFNDIFANYSITENPDGSVSVAHTTVPAGLVSDGVDTLRNIELAQFADRTVSLIKPTLELNGFDLSTRTWGDNFGVRAYDNNNASASEAFNGAWAEANDAGGATGGSVQITTGGTLTFSPNNADDASVTRALNLEGAASALVSFTIADTGVVGLLDNEEILFEFAADGVSFETLRTFNGDNGGNIVVALPTDAPFGAAAAIRFRANNTLDPAGFLQAAESFSIDNLTINAVFQQPAAAPSIDIMTSYSEDATATSIGSDPRITDDGATMASARIVLTNAFAGDTLVIPGSLTAPGAAISATSLAVGTTLVVTLTGTASLAAYQAAIQSIGFRNTSQDPDPTQRIIETTVNDGVFDSNVARTFVNVQAVNDPVNANADTVISNSTMFPILIPDWALLANDIDLDDLISLTATSAAAGLTVTRTTGAVAITADAGGAGGSFSYAASDGSTTDNANVTVQRPTAQNINGNNGADIILGDDRASTITANGGNDIVLTGAGNDVVAAGTGDDTMVWTVGDGRDRFDGGANEDTVRIEGSDANEAFVVYSRIAALANGIAGLNANTEIVITRNGTVISELDNVEEIVINTGDGVDNVTTLGDFAPTSLNFNTITVEGGAGSDTIDISGLQSAHRILFRSSGGDDTIVGTLRPQDVIELGEGKTLSDYEATQNPDGTTTLSSADHSITFRSSGAPTFQSAAPAASPDEAEDSTEAGTGAPGAGGGAPLGSSGGFAVTAADLVALKNLVNGIGLDGGAGGIRTLDGNGNNVDNPTWGNADQPFIRLTDARYGAYDATTGNRLVNPIFDGLDPRTISNIIGDQEDGLPKAASEANIFFMAFGQYFDHGLDFLPKGGNGVIEIGGPGAERAPGADNPADLTRGAVAFIDADGVPQHMNMTSPFVDQNQAYGSHSLVGQFLRGGDGAGGLTSRLFSGAPDPSAPQFNLLPTLRELINEHWENDTIFKSATGDVSFRTYYAGLVGSDGAIDASIVSAMASNFMGSGHPLLLDTNPFQNLLDHYVAGDGRANENFALTSMHTVWARNHNFHVDNLDAAGFEGTPEELYQAAKILNEAEYARVVFDEFADALIGGMRGSGSHGDSGYNPEANAGISHEFAAAVYRVGHSLIGQTLTVMDETGQPKQVALFDAFLNPSNDASTYSAPLPPGYVPQPGYEQLGVSNILGGIVTQQAEEVDFNIVDAVRSDLVRINADLFSFNVARSWDVGLGTLNQIRMGLQASQDPYVSEAVGFAGALTPYASWEDFQTRNGLSDTVINQFMQAYPDLVLQDAAEIASFQAANPDIALVNGNTVKGIDRVDLWVGGLAEKHINGGMVGQTFWVVLHEQFDRLQEGDRYYYTARLDNLDLYENQIDGQNFSDIVARTTGLSNLGEHIFFVDDEDEGANEQPGGGDSTPLPGGGDGDPDDGAPVTGGGDDEPDVDEENGVDLPPTGGSEGEEDEDDDLPPMGGSEDDEDAGADEEDDELPPTTGSGDNDNDNDNDDDNEEDVDLPPTGGSGDDDEEVDEDDGVTPTPGAGTGSSAPTAPRVGTVNADVLVGSALAEDFVAFAGDDVVTAGAGDDTVLAGEGADFVRAGAGRDMVFAGAGDDMVYADDGADMVYGEAGHDRVFAGAGNDLVDAGAGDDTVFGGAGNDMFIASIGDGVDTYFGDDQDGAAGVDTLDMSAILANATVDLGTGSRGSASSAQSGTDILWSVENVITGAGDDIITAGIGVNVLDGGDGDDTFRFESVAAINGDRILGFEPGDKIDLAGIDANYGAAGDQAFTIASSSALTAPGQVTITYETTPNGEITVVQGNVDADNGADFRLEIQGHQTLTNQNFGL
ncbi:MAG: peroxidase family protein [Beijerinckiaceae bacterium]|nr:peroxidase family protein [Beijerinckiaceae bacterium]